VLDSCQNYVVSGAFSRDGHLVAASSVGRSANVWDARTGELVALLARHVRRINDLDLSPDGSRLVTASDDGTARIWDVRTSTCLRVLKKPNVPRTAVAFLPGGSSVVIGDADGETSIWNTQTGERTAVLSKAGLWNDSVNPAPETVHFVGPSTDGKLVAAASRGQGISIWSLPGGERVGFADIPIGLGISVGFSPDGSRIVVSGPSRSPQIRDTVGQHLFTLVGGRHPVVFSPDGNCLLTAVKGTGAKIWRRRRPEWWWGIFWLQEFWLTVFFSALLLWSLYRDRKYFKSLAAKQPQPSPLEPTE